MTKAAFFYSKNTRTQEREEINENPIIAYDWRVLTSLLLDPQLTDEILDFVKELGLIDIYSEKIKISGTFQTADALYMLKKPVSNPIGLSKLLNFLKIDLLAIENLVNEAVTKQSFEQAAAFLYTFEAGLNKNDILTEALRS